MAAIGSCWLPAGFPAVLRLQHVAQHATTASGVVALLQPLPRGLTRDLALSAAAAVLQNVPETTHFAPHVRCEIGAFGWYIVDHLPASYDESKQVRKQAVQGLLAAGCILGQMAGFSALSD